MYKLLIESLLNKKKMKNIVIILLIILGVEYISAQPTCDIVTNGIEPAPAFIRPGEASDLTFQVYNDAAGGSCEYDTSSVAVLVFWDNATFEFDTVVMPGPKGPYFDWSYIGDGVVFGLNHTAIPDGEGETVVVRIKGRTRPSYPWASQIGITLLQYEEGPIFPSNNPLNDNGICTVTIEAPLPIELSSFTAKTRQCQDVLLEWVTESENNNAFIELQRSEDGRHYSLISTFEPSNKLTKTRYEYWDKEIENGRVYYYRLRQVDFDGTETIFDPIVVRTPVCNGVHSMTVYPNPVMDRLNLDIQGFDVTDQGDITIFNSIGEVVETFKGITVKEFKDIDVSRYQSGVYSVQLESVGSVFVQKFVKII